VAHHRRAVPRTARLSLVRRPRDAPRCARYYPYASGSAGSTRSSPTTKPALHHRYASRSATAGSARARLRLHSSRNAAGAAVPPQVGPASRSATAGRLRSPLAQHAGGAAVARLLPNSAHLSGVRRASGAALAQGADPACTPGELPFVSTRREEGRPQCRRVLGSLPLQAPDNRARGRRNSLKTMIARAGANAKARSHSLSLAIDESTKATTSAAAAMITNHSMIRSIIPPSSTPIHALLESQKLAFACKTSRPDDPTKGDCRREFPALATGSERIPSENRTIPLS